MKFIQLTELVRIGRQSGPGGPIIVQLSNVTTIKSGGTAGTVIEFVGGGQLTVSEVYDDVKRMLGL